jgi:trehalose 6-phosphate synthase/phosphatase
MTIRTPLETITTKYLSAKRRLIILDYDGTLTSFKPTPPEAKPSDSLKRLLAALACDPCNDVAILSGRDRATLTEWFGELPIVLGAEHGFFVKPVGQPWHATKHAHTEWKPAIRDIMAEADLPGAFIEDKVVGVVWQYRRCDQVRARKVAARLIEELAEASEGLNLNIMHGNRVVEVLPPGANKGTAARHWMGERAYDFVLAAGDDRTDRDMFAALEADPTAYSIDIGAPGIADTAVASPTALRDWLGSLVAA